MDSRPHDILASNLHRRSIRLQKNVEPPWRHGWNSGEEIEQCSKPVDRASLVPGTFQMFPLCTVQLDAKWSTRNKKNSVRTKEICPNSPEGFETRWRYGQIVSLRKGILASRGSVLGFSIVMTFFILILQKHKISNLHIQFWKIIILFPSIDFQFGIHESYS